MVRFYNKIPATCQCRLNNPLDIRENQIKNNNFKNIGNKIFFKNNRHIKKY